LLFTIYFIFDVLSTLYLKAVQELKAIRASNLSTILYLMSVYGTIEYINNFACIIPIAIGGWLGSYVTIKWVKKRNSEKNSQGGNRTSCGEDSEIKN
jgi:uncharacterized membrane protein YfcA